MKAREEDSTPLIEMAFAIRSSRDIIFLTVGFELKLPPIADQIETGSEER
jgi:hypothetical protein